MKYPAGYERGSEALESLVRKSEAAVGHPICGFPRERNGEVTVCKRYAGHGTQHVGSGRCRLHGGCGRKSILETQALKKGLAVVRQRAKKAGRSGFSFQDMIPGDLGGRPRGLGVVYEIEKIRESIAVIHEQWQEHIAKLAVAMQMGEKQEGESDADYIVRTASQANQLRIQTGAMSEHFHYIKGLSDTLAKLVLTQTAVQKAGNYSILEAMDFQSRVIKAILSLIDIPEDVKIRIAKVVGEVPVMLTLSADRPKEIPQKVLDANFVSVPSNGSGEDGEIGDTGEAEE